MEHLERLRVRSLLAQACRETDSARGRFAAHENLEEMDPAFGMLAFLEEVGKLARTQNKLRISHDPEVQGEWRKEQDRRFVTCMSLLTRIYLHTRR